LAEVTALCEAVAEIVEVLRELHARTAAARAESS
jgi:hypothetical protein